MKFQLVQPQEWCDRGWKTIAIPQQAFWLGRIRSFWKAHLHIDSKNLNTDKTITHYLRIECIHKIVMVSAQYDEGAMNSHEGWEEFMAIVSIVSYTFSLFTRNFRYSSTGWSLACILISWKRTSSTKPLNLGVGFCNVALVACFLQFREVLIEAFSPNPDSFPKTPQARNPIRTWTGLIAHKLFSRAAAPPWFRASARSPTNVDII